ncbi:MAG TPA: hypothetical protein VKR30_06150 [Candidatus Limnocylindrales bacterium]|nr:hypothetical protein [Candidatus Limnocylindrales bacterium]
MFGMVTALVVQDSTSASIERAAGVGPAVAAAAATGSTALLCHVP